MTEPNGQSRGMALAVVVVVLSALGMLMTIATLADQSSWGAALVVGILGPIGAIVLAGLGVVAATRAQRTGVRVTAGVGIALAAVGLVLSMLLWAP